jgi:hypothetical protein
MHQLCAGPERSGVRVLEVVNAKPDLRPLRHGGILRLIESEVDEGSIRPRNRGVTSAGPPIVTTMVIDMQVEPKAIAVELNRSIEVAHLEDDGDESARVHSHILLGIAPMG